MASKIEKDVKYIPEMSQTEINNLNKTIKAASIKVIEENIERMKKTWTNRPKIMEYFDEISNLFGRRAEELREQKKMGKKISSAGNPSRSAVVTRKTSMVIKRNM